MINFPNCKINLGLNIIGKRTDGYHDLETVFYPLPYKDALEVIEHYELQIAKGEVKNNADGNETFGASTMQHRISHTEHPTSTHFSSSGLTIKGKEEDNLCIKAYYLIKKDFPQLPVVNIHLHKNIPMGAGLGGGSADSAFMLKLLNEKFDLELSTPQLIQYALELGSDCPFFIINKPCMASGRGELMQEINLDLGAYSFVIVNPGIHINTGWAFAQIVPQLPKKNVFEIISQHISAWKETLVNDFEDAVAKEYPAIANIKQQLYNLGAVYASMSGSGSTVYGIFRTRPSDISFPKEYNVFFM